MYNIILHVNRFPDPLICLKILQAAAEARDAATTAVTKAEELEKAAKEIAKKLVGEEEESSSFQQKIEGEW